MAERGRFREPFVNPYVDESANAARLSAMVTMDEVQERWRRGSWQPDEEDFQLSPSWLTGDGDDGAEGVKVRPVPVADGEAAPEGNRFAFDLKKDIIYADKEYTEPDDVAYTDSYRPRGDIGSGISNIALDKMRYNALAGIQEELPEDLSYLYGESAEKRVERKAAVRDRLYNRLDTPVEKRRAKVDQMIPERRGETPEMIMAEVKKRRAAEDARDGIVRKPAVRRKSNLYQSFGLSTGDDVEPEEETFDVERVTGQGSWRSSLPEQDGLVPDSRAMPYFGRFSRTWSKIDQTDPSRTDLLKHTVNTIYDYEDSDEEGRKFRANGRGSRGYYVDDADFDPDDRYRRLRRKRRRVAADQNVLTGRIMSGEFNNPYVDISDTRLKNIINHDLRGPGQSPEPQGLTDPALIHEWNLGYSRVNTDENQYAAWFEQQSELAEHAEQSRYRGSHRTGRPGAYMQRERPYGEGRRYPGGTYSEREVHRRDMREQMQRATQQGMADGEEMVRRRREAERRAEEEHIRAQQEQQRKAYEQQRELYRKQQEQMMRQQQEYWKRQQELMKRQQEQNAAGNLSRQNPQQTPWGQYPQANPQQAAQGQYPGVNPQQAPWGQYPQMNPQQAAWVQYPGVNPQQAAWGQYPQMNPQQAARGQYPQMNPQQAARGPYPQMNPQQPAQGQHAQTNPQGGQGRNGRPR